MQSFLPDYELKRITPETLDQVEEVYTTNGSFFMLTAGRPATIDDCRVDMEALPPGFAQSQKYYLNVYDKKTGGAIAVVDLLCGYPDDNSVWLGLLLVHGAYKRQRIGSAVVDVIVNAAKQRGFASLQLGVVAGNETALSFWNSNGFNEIRNAKSKRQDNIEMDVIVMERRIM
jgi:ribosomal protein S18 acetylase RimI-like enzyme